MVCCCRPRVLGAGKRGKRLGGNPRAAGLGLHLPKIAQNSPAPPNTQAEGGDGSGDTSSQRGPRRDGNGGGQEGCGVRGLGDARSHILPKNRAPGGAEAMGSPFPLTPDELDPPIWGGGRYGGAAGTRRPQCRAEKWGPQCRARGLGPQKGAGDPSAGHRDGDVGWGSQSGHGDPNMGLESPVQDKGMWDGNKVQDTGWAPQCGAGDPSAGHGDPVQGW